MTCTTFDHIEENGQMIMRPKKQFDTLDAAIIVAKLENAKPDHIHKVVGYKCNVCHKYHIGRNGKELKDKERNKLQKEFGIQKQRKKQQREYALSNLKVVGWIDLNKIRY